MNLPVAQRVFDTFGRLIALGSLSHEEALLACLDVASSRQPDIDVGGLRMRLSWALHDAHAAVRANRARCRRELKKIVEAMMNNRVPEGPLLNEFYAQHESMGAPLTEAELRSILAEEARWLHARMRKSGRRYV